MIMRVSGWFPLLVGSAVAVFSQKIVFPGLEVLIGIEAIVGADNVVYLEEGGYLYTNPGAMCRWISSVALVGVLMAAGGIVLLIKSKKGTGANKTMDATSQ